MVPTIQRTIEELLDSLESEHEFDLAGSLAHPLPASVIFALLGVPSENWSQLKQWCGFRAALSWGRPAPEEQIEIATNMASYRRYLFALVERKKRDRGDDLTSDLLAIHDEDPERLTLEEIASILFSLSFAGHETTSGLIGNTMRRLLEQPAAWAEVVADPKLSDAAVGETLRFDTSVPAWRRMVKEEVEIAGIRLPAGARIFIWLVAVNRDPGVFRNPDTFDLHREDAHLALSFGKGIHYCLGASLGRVEAAMAVAELARRYPSLRLRDGQALTFHPNISFRGPQSLWVEVSSQRRPPDGP